MDNADISPIKAKKKLISMQETFHQRFDYFSYTIDTKQTIHPYPPKIPQTTHEQDHLLIADFARLCTQKNISTDRVDAFFDAMLADTNHTPYQTYKELKKYMYGSAEVIGLMMCKLI